MSVKLKVITVGDKTTLPLYFVICRQLRLKHLMFWRNCGIQGKPIYTQKMGDRTKAHGKVIDVYDLTGSNCVTHTVQAS
jgi:hypothetical protein